ncbi:PKD domain-containing protein [Bacteroidota bacterium]
MKKVILFLLSFAVIGVLALTLTSCSEDDPADPPTVTIFASVDGYQVAFTATAENTTSYSWDFGDAAGTSTEQNPVYTYTQSGSYTAICTVTGDGGTATDSTSVTIAASKLEMLTGGPGAANGKTWKFSPVSGEGDGIYKANLDAEFEDPLPDGILGLIGIASEYNDQVTFKNDLSFDHDADNDSVVATIFYAMFNSIGYRATAEDAIVLAPYTVPSGATFTFTEDTDLTLTVVDHDGADDTSDTADDELTTEEVTWSGIDVLEITSGFLGILDVTPKYVIHSISTDVLQVGIFIAVSEDNAMTLGALNPSHEIRMTFIPATN